MKKTILIIVITLIVLSYLGVIKFNPDRTKEILINAGKTTKQTAVVAKGVATEAKKEYERQTQ